MRAGCLPALEPRQNCGSRLCVSTKRVARTDQARQILKFFLLRCSQAFLHLQAASGTACPQTSSTSIDTVRVRLWPRAILATRSCCWWTWVGWNPGSTNSRDLTKRTRCGATLKSAQRRQPSSGVGMERPRRHLRLALNDGQVGTYRGGRHGPCDLVLANRA